MSTKIKFESLSSAQFIRKNPQFVALDNPAKGGFTSIRELIENSIDGVEFARIRNPVIRIIMDNLGLYYKLMVEDNGYGIPYKHVPNAFGKMFYGSHYSELKQTRGILGLGGKAVLVYGYLSTRKPYRVVTAIPNSREIHVFDLGINIHKNEPIIFRVKERKKEHTYYRDGHYSVANTKNWHGTIIRMYTRINLDRMTKIINYLKLTTIAMPYITLSFSVGEKEVITTDKGEQKTVIKRVELFNHKGKDARIPVPARSVKLHPHGVDTEDLQELINKEKKKNGEKKNKNLTLEKFMMKKFQGIGQKTAIDFAKFVGFNKNKNISKLSHRELMIFVDKLKKYDGFRSPNTNCLSFLTRQNIEIGMQEMYKPDYVSYTTKKGVYSGHGFIVEASCAIGGKIKPPRSDYKFKVLRFANKIPLLYDQRSCALHKNVMEIDFKRYNIEGKTPLIILVHFASTKVPYKTGGKEYISADYPNINRTVKLCVQEALRMTKNYMFVLRKQKHLKARMNVFNIYTPQIAENLASITGKDENNIIKLIKNVLHIEDER